MRRILAVVAVLFVVRLATAPTAEAADLWRATLVPGADAGTGAKVEASWLPGNQFMLSCSSAVTYRLCPWQDAGTCAATATDAPVEANKQIDLCAPSGYTALSVYASSASCNVYLVTPKTVCQTP